MKKIILTLAMVSVTFAFAQKKEVESAFKAIEANDVATANAQISAAEGILGGKIYLLEPSLQEKYYYAKGLSLLKSGKTLEGASYLAKISDLGKTPVFEGKDGKIRVYFVGKTAADASGISGLKESKYVPTLQQKLAATVDPIFQKTFNEGSQAFNSKKYDVAGPKFREAYDLLKAAGVDNKQILYYSAMAYSTLDNKSNAIAVYKELVDSGYNGVETTYTAKNKKTGEVVNLAKADYDLEKIKGAASDFSDFKVETTPSTEHEFYETLAGLQIDAEQYDAAIITADKGLAKFPKNGRLSELKGLAYYKAGKTDEFIASLKDVIAKNPNDKVSWYNLGVLASKDPAKAAEAEGYFKKALEIDPNYSIAHQNLVYVIMDTENDGKHIDEYNAARKAGKSDLANKIMDARRARFARALPYAEKWYAADPNNIDAVSILKGLYQSTRNDAKYNEFKAKEAAMQKK